MTKLLLARSPKWNHKQTNSSVLNLLNEWLNKLKFIIIFNMALNPPLGQGMIPFRVDGEHFCLQRDGVEFELKINGMGTLKGAGKVVVTTMRLILINPLGKPTFKAFDLPLALTHHEKFN